MHLFLNCKCLEKTRRLYFRKVCPLRKRFLILTIGTGTPYEKCLLLSLFSNS